MTNTACSCHAPNKEIFQDPKVAVFGRPGSRPNPTDCNYLRFQPNISSHIPSQGSILPSYSSQASVLCKGQPGSHQFYSLTSRYIDVHILY